MSGYHLQTNKPITCPCCSKCLDGATGEQWPKEDDISVCIYCGTVLQFKGRGMDIKLTIATAELIAELQKDHADVWRQISRIKEAVNHLKHL